MPTILIEKNIMVPMRDGVKLATDIYRLQDAPPTPALVVRTPYNKEVIVAHSEVFDILRAVQAGYPVVAQDVRGRYASEGTFTPHVQETADGVDAFAWAAAQPWSNGVMGTFGGSYLGCTQWLPARERPPAPTRSLAFRSPRNQLMYKGNQREYNKIWSYYIHFTI